MKLKIVLTLVCLFALTEFSMAGRRGGRSINTTPTTVTTDDTIPVVSPL